MRKRDPVVAYFYDEEVGNYCLGGNNPMRPHRARMTHSLLTGYNLDQKLIVNRPQPRSFEQLTNFHADEYIQFLKSVTPDNQDEFMTQLRRFNMGVAGEADCPVFDGMYQFCQLYSGASVNGASALAEGKADICVNWSGGMHHAKKGEASGFCYVNDIVLAILELLKVYARVLYVDIDIHHGDGVEEAFYLTDRVMTVSFHKYGDFFPGTGALADIGHQRGKYYSVNVPLRDGMDDDSYKGLFEPIMEKVMQLFQPGAIVVCAGADSLSGDKLGCFNLSIEGHSHCLEFLSKFNVPMLVLGGGGYTMRNVARCWCYETASLAGVNLPDLLPESALAQYNYYLDTQRLRIAVSNMKNSNTPEELERIKRQVLQNLSRLPAAPSAQIAQTPALLKAEDGAEEDMDARGGGAVLEERRRVREGDESDGEEEGPGRKRRDVGFAAGLVKAEAEGADAEMGDASAAAGGAEQGREQQQHQQLNGGGGGDEAGAAAANGGGGADVGTSGGDGWGGGGARATPEWGSRIEGDAEGGAAAAAYGGQPAVQVPEAGGSSGGAAAGAGASQGRATADAPVASASASGAAPASVGQRVEGGAATGNDEDSKAWVTSPSSAQHNPATHPPPPPAPSLAAWQPIGGAATGAAPQQVPPSHPPPPATGGSAMDIDQQQ